MALPTTGTISLLQVAAELGISPPLSLNDSRTRALAGIPTGTIDLNSLRGKSAVDLTPDGANWTDVVWGWNSTNGSSSTPNWKEGNSVTIAGLTSGQSIQLKLNLTDIYVSGSPSTNAAFIDVLKNNAYQGSVWARVNASGTPSYGASNLSVTNGDVVKFRCGTNVLQATNFNTYTYMEAAMTVQILNVSMGNAVIDTFTFNGNASDSYSTGGGGIEV